MVNAWRCRRRRRSQRSDRECARDVAANQLVCRWFDRDGRVAEQFHLNVTRSKSDR